jgi:PQQ-like domain
VRRQLPAGNQGPNPHKDIVRLACGLLDSIAALVLAGCAARGTALEAWSKPKASSNIENERLIDDAQCTAYSMRAVPLPTQYPAAMPSQAHSSQYQVNGSINGVPYTGTVQEQPTPVSNMVLYAYDAESGKQLWSSGKTLSDWVHFSEPVVAAGKIFVATHDGHVVAFGLKK